MSFATDLPLIILPDKFAICQLPVDTPFPDWGRSNSLLAFVRTSSELSVVCDERYAPPDVKAERGWRCFLVQGPLDFSMVGVLSAVTTPLAQAGIGIFVISTYDTDYILVKESALDRAQNALIQAGFLVKNYVDLSA
jgi:hypothetical protein